MKTKRRPLTRSENMGRIRSKDTKPEMVIRQGLHARGYRFRLHRRDLPGTPDLVLPKRGAVVEVRGCYWHATRDADARRARTRSIGGRS